MFLVPIVHAATQLILASKKSRPIDTLSSASLRTNSSATSFNSSSITITWSLSHLTGLDTCNANLSLYNIMAEILLKSEERRVGKECRFRWRECDEERKERV